MKKNISRFGTNYVSHPRVYADLFERLQRIGGLDCAVLGIDKTENCFFAAACLLAQCPTEEKAESSFSFDMCDRTFQDHAWDICLENIRPIISSFIFFFLSNGSSSFFLLRMGGGPTSVQDSHPTL